MNRRDILTAAPALGFVGLMPAGAASTIAATETPVAIAYREWKVMRDFMHNDTGDMPEAEFDALCDRNTAMDRAMFELPNADIRDAALKLLEYTDGGRDFAEDGYGTGSDCCGKWVR